MTLDSLESAAPGFILQVERFYAGLMRAAKPALAHETWNQCPDSEPNLGGKLFYAGELNSETRALIVAANIAGAATLAALADAEARKQFMREGIVDFLVTSLDEALRILKNEVRKRETVAVCVALESEISEAEFAREMIERGVRPDLTRADTDESPQAQALLAWSVAAAPAIWLPKLDALAADCLHSEEKAARRWLRLAPRYLGRLAQGVRLLRCAESSAAKFLERMRQEVELGEIGIAVELALTRKGKLENYTFMPQIG